MKIGYCASKLSKDSSDRNVFERLKSRSEVDQIDWLELSEFEIVVENNEISLKFPDKVVKSKSDYDLIIVKGGHGDIKTAVLISHFCKQKDIPLYDNGLSEANHLIDKRQDTVSLSLAGVSMPKTVLFSKAKNIEDITNELSFPLIVKPNSSSQGIGVTKVNSIEEIESFISSSKWDLHRVVFQEFINYKYDLRLFVLGDKVLGVMRRIPQGDEFRANFSLGGDIELFDANDEIKDMAVKAAKACNVEVTGVDILIDQSDRAYVLEVNRSPGLTGISKVLGFRVSEKIAEYILKSRNLI